jgi:molybdopterin converting factor small subunit
MNVLFFAQAADAADCTAEHWDVREPMTLSDFWAEAVRRHPALDAIRAHCRVASNLEYVAENQTLDPDGETAVLPPVSGG